MREPPSLHRLVCDLIAIPSVSHDSIECGKVIDHVHALFADREDLNIRGYEVNGHPSIVITYGTDRTPDVLLQAHLDVVPAPPHCFTPREEQGKLFGRGAIDMKGAAAALIRAFHEHVTQKRRLSLGLMLTTDEEVGGFDGVKYLVEEEGYRPRCVVLPDGGIGFQLIERQYGVVWVKVTRMGIAAHTSRPEEGDNAILSFMRSFTKLQEALAPMQETLLSLSKINAGTAVNVIPGSCEAFIDIRTAYPEKIPPILSEIFAADEYEILEEESSYALDHAHPHVAVFKEVMERQAGAPPVIAVERGASDARFFEKFSIPVLLTTGIGGNYHGDDEWVDMQSLAAFERLTSAFLQELSTRADIGGVADIALQTPTQSGEA